MSSRLALPASHLAVPARTELRVDGLLLLVALAWGSTYLVAKVLVDPESVLALLALRMLVAAPLLIGFVAVSTRRLPTGAELRIGVALGVLLAGVFLIETFGIAHTSATNAGVIISLTIVFTPLLEAAVSRRRPRTRFFVAAAGAMVGAALLTSGGGLSVPSLGDGLVLGAAALRAVHVTTMQRLTASRPADTTTLTAVQLATCAVVFAAGSCVVGTPLPTYVRQLTPADLALVAYLAVACTVFAFFVQMWAVRRTSPTRVSLLLGTEPVWAALIGATLGHDTLGLVAWLGVAVVLFSTAWGRRIEAHSAHLTPPRPPRRAAAEAAPSSVAP